MIIGIDEVGKGAIAGGVVVGCVAIPQKLIRNLEQLPHIMETRKNRPHPYRDSKQLSPKQRQYIYDQITNNPQIKYHIAHQSNQNIDNLGISQCTRLAVGDALIHTLAQLKPNTKIQRISIDHIHNIEPTIQNIIEKQNINPNININIAKQGDAKFLEIALASIIAKIERDNAMVQLCQTFQGYNLANNKGYGTPQHINAVRQLGLTTIHRKSVQLKTLMPLTKSKSKSKAKAKAKAVTVTKT